MEYVQLKSTKNVNYILTKQKICGIIYKNNTEREKIFFLSNINERRHKRLSEGEIILIKGEFIEKLAAETGTTKKDAEKYFDATTKLITDILADGDSLSIVGFGKFGVKDRPERTGHNPATGEEITIPAARVPYFKPGTILKNSVK